MDVNFVKLNIFKALLYKALAVTKKVRKIVSHPLFFFMKLFIISPIKPLPRNLMRQGFFYGKSVGMDRQ
ncbi:hypothetical protein DKE41_014820 [Acinetobacter pittii]|nr:hypothetical protein DKE41_014820 [Acinetobacter pittii]